MTRPDRDDHDAGHGALLYEDPGAFTAGAAAFIRSGLDDRDHVMAVVTPEKFRWLREELGTGAAAVEHVDANAFYARHGPMLGAVVRLLQRHATPGTGRLRMVAEQALELRAPADVRAYMRYEAASNVVVDGYD